MSIETKVCNKCGEEKPLARSSYRTIRMNQIQPLNPNSQKKQLVDPAQIVAQMYASLPRGEE